VADSREALPLLRERFPATPLRPSPHLSERAGTGVHLKLESELPTGSFKVRGALYALWKHRQDREVLEVVAASTGNHGAAVAWAARELGVPAHIYVPVGANAVKIDRIRSLGAHLTETGADIEAARRAAEAHAVKPGALLLDDATDAHVPVGAGTIGIELLEQMPSARVVIVPVGDSALIRGVASALKAAHSDVRIIGVQAVGAPAYHRSWHAGRVIETATADTIADGLATTRPTASNVEGIRRLVDEMVLVTDEAMIDAMRLLVRGDDVIAEPSSAASVAALLQSPLPLDGPVIALITGSNVAPEIGQA
jgi:threonine dehydratase